MSRSRFNKKRRRKLGAEKRAEVRRERHRQGEFKFSKYWRPNEQRDPSDHSKDKR